VAVRRTNVWPGFLKTVVVRLPVDVNAVPGLLFYVHFALVDSVRVGRNEVSGYYFGKSFRGFCSFRELLCKDKYGVLLRVGGNYHRIIAVQKSPIYGTNQVSLYKELPYFVPCTVPKDFHYPDLPFAMVVCSEHGIGR
tara:strand:- start:421 stop:834 length:414 start_codon:yes stop_codon:yes gene_type:complete